MQTVITWGGGVSKVAKITGPRVLSALIRVDRGGKVELPAPPTVRVTSTTDKFDVVSYEEGWDLDTFSEMRQEPVNIGGTPFSQPATKVVKVIRT